MFEWISGLLEKGSYFGLFFLMFLENVFPPIPSELIMPFGGYLAKQGKLIFFWVVVVGSLGSVVGSLPLYYAGKILGEKRLKTLADKHGVWLALSGEDISKAKKWFDARRGAAVFGCRIIPGVRSLIAIPAGIAQMPLPQFCFLTFAGSFIWALFLASLGFFLGEGFKTVDKFLGPISYLILGGLIAFFAFKVWKRKQKQSKTRRAHS
ncbi:MAG TPA: DedA family protein [Abditibacterium sp.]|jgi:membrane protein DedA with SNARE-associated domain